MVKNTEPDGDKKKEEAKEWAEKRIAYLPSDVAPEKWLIETLSNEVKTDEQKISETLLATWGIDNEKLLIDYLHAAVQAGAHLEFYTLSEEISIDKDTLLTDVIRSIKRLFPEHPKELLNCVNELLDGD